MNSSKTKIERINFVTANIKFIYKQVPNKVCFSYIKRQYLHSFKRFSAINLGVI